MDTGLKEVIKITKNIIRLHYTTRENLCKAFLRFEEHYESPEFKGKVFTLGQYREWYCEYYGQWSYYQDWSGFNVPSHALKKFFDGMFDPLTKEEQEIVNLFKYKKGEFYIIGTYEGSEKDVLDHEICHAMFSLDKEYRSEVYKKLSIHIKELEPLMVHLTELGYNDSVINDECNAYLAASEDYLIEKKIKYPKELAKDLAYLKESYRDQLIK